MGIFFLLLVSNLLNKRIRHSCLEDRENSSRYLKGMKFEALSNEKLINV